MNLRKIHLIILIMWGMRFCAVNAQQDPMYTMYMWNMMVIDPAYAGSAGVLNVTALSRAQWSGLEGAPVTHSISAHAPITRKSLGVGASVVSDRIGQLGTTSAFADISYRFRLTKKIRMAWGVKVGTNQTRMNNTSVLNTDPNDPLFAYDQSGEWMPNIGAGMYIWSDRSYFGAAIPKVKRNRIGSVEQEQGIVFAKENPHLFIIGGHVLGHGDVKFKPSFVLRMAEGSPISGDISANMLLRDRLWLGLALRDGRNASAIFSLQLNDQFRAGYAYDMPLRLIAGRDRGSHEIMFSYDPVFNRDKIRSPRYF